MEKEKACIYRENAIMKKILGIAASLVLVVIAANAQSGKKEPPPPPPPKPKEEVKFNPPKIVKDDELKEPPVIEVTGKLADEFYQKNPCVSGISRQGNIITLIMKDGTSEKYDMSKKEEAKSFTGKYGKSPIPPPPPPPKIIVRRS